MARIAGINIPDHKHAEIGLTSIYGVGRSTAQKICEAVGIPYSKKIKELSDHDLEKIREEVGRLTIAAGATHGVLAVYSSTRVLPATVEADRGIREVLEDKTNNGVELYTEYLDIPRFGGDAYARTMASFLREKYSSHPPEVIIGGGEDVLEFLLRYRTSLFPGVPLVHAAIEASYLRSMQPLPADVVGTPIDYDCVGTIQLAFRLNPKARHLVLVTGASDWDRRWDTLLRSEAARLPAGARPEFLSGLPTETVSRRLAELGDDTVVFTPGYFKDGAGRVASATARPGLPTGQRGWPAARLGRPPHCGNSVILGSCRACGGRSRGHVSR